MGTISCPSLPLGYSVAPRGGGTAVLTQTGDQIVGTLFIFGNPAGTLRGTVIGNAVSLDIDLNGRNVGTLTPADEPCRVVGSGTGTTDFRCSVDATLNADFACPYQCNPAQTTLRMLAATPAAGCPRS